MSLYHETASILTSPSTHGGSLKSRIYGNKDLKSPPAQVYALAFESSKWSAVLKEVVENSQLLQTERKLTPALSILLVHDFLLAKKGIALPASHGLRMAVEKHKARIQSEFSRARIRRKCPTVEALRAMVDAQLGPPHPRWVRVNTLKSTIDEQLETTFRGFEMVATVEEVMAAGATGKRVICLDGHIPNLIAASPGTDFTKTDAYKSGTIILQDKASCFPAYLLDPRPEDGDIIDACSAPGNKTTHLAGILHERGFARDQHIIAFEKDRHRAKTLQNMIKTAGSDSVTVIHPGQDFLKTDPHAPEFRRVGALLLDPSCSGSGIVGRDDTPEFHLPSTTTSSSSCSASSSSSSKPPPNRNRKRKRPQQPSSSSDSSGPNPPTTTTTSSSSSSTNTAAAAVILVDDEGNETQLTSPQALQARLAALAAFQLSILLHAFTFPAARKVTYSTCSVHAVENEGVVLRALGSDIARQRGWRVLRRAEQVRGMREWPVRGDGRACGDDVVADGCVRSSREDGRGVMGFFVVCFVREETKKEEAGEAGDEEGPYVRDAQGRIVRDENGIPTLKSTGRKAVELGISDSDQEEEEEEEELRFGGADDQEGPFERDAAGRIVRGPDGMPRLKKAKTAKEEDEQDRDEWGGFDD
ncbi:S-adenosyl-L-methionine-dependent methyltransferase [Chaetomium strumarium]|uniref:S-adenosyl-L-methionine-dependent methyltransferase n=1 Tax=Chaetomium strumarium TaxID=1170767 RepID=A0AAJ0LYB5_9PEZI|nr:S-adenosyl-L-methionine-dependent methyltransferase [Chaetomium strumarium]